MPLHGPGGRSGDALLLDAQINTDGAENDTSGIEKSEHILDDVESLTKDLAERAGCAGGDA